MSLPTSPLRSVRRRGRGRFASERGVALVEFALVLPFLLLVIFGMIDLGKAVNYWNDETHLANSAARFASVNGCTACGTFTINDYVLNSAATADLKTATFVIGFVDNTGKYPGDADYVGAAPAVKNHCAGQAVKVTVSYDYTFFNFATSNFTFLKGPLTKTIRSTSTQRIEKNWGDAGGVYRPGYPAPNTDTYDASGASPTRVPDRPDEIGEENVENLLPKNAGDTPAHGRRRGRSARPGNDPAARLPQPLPQQRQELERERPPCSSRRPSSRRARPRDAIAKKDLFEVTSIPKDQLKDGAVTDAAVLHGQVALDDIYPGQQLTITDFGVSATSEPALGVARPARRQARRPARGARSRSRSTPSHGIIPQAQTGDHVDVYVSS